jgi:HK97 family phage prohead protease
MRPTPDYSQLNSRLVTLSDGRPGLRTPLICEVKDMSDAEDNTLSFVATDETLDRYDEVISIDGWDTGNYLKNPVVVDSHNYGSIGCILGRTIDLTIANGQMINQVQFATDNPLGALAYKMAKAGFIRSESVGFRPKEWVMGNGKDQPYRTFTKQELLEISLVAVPANPGATIGAAIKSGAIDRGDIRATIDHLTRFADQPVTTTPTWEPQPVDAAHLRQLANLLQGLNAALKA